MNIKVLSDWVDAIATVAVVIGLALLILEIQVNTEAIERQAAVERASALTEPFYESAEMRMALEKIRTTDAHGGATAAFIKHYDMTPEEAIVWNRHCVQLWAMVRSDFNFGNRELAKGFAKALAASPDQRLFIENWHAFDSEFGQMVRDVLVELDSVTESN